MSRAVRYTMLSLLAALILASGARADGFRIAAAVHEPFEFNGRLFPAGAVTLREISRYSPTTTLNELWVGDQFLGRHLAEASDDYWGRIDDALLFERNPKGPLVLVGFALRGHEAREFRFR